MPVFFMHKGNSCHQHKKPNPPMTSWSRTVPYTQEPFHFPSFPCFKR
uniref:Uncharacterized protein n=1 Tax=Arundo donax TaxID=35708 RepID=A0A0A9F0R8_ARUDO